MVDRDLLTKIRTYLDKEKDRHIKRICSFIAQPSISVEDTGVRECAEQLVERFKELGCNEAELVETGGLPGVWAYLDVGADKTIANYANFDTRPVVDKTAWDYPPFEGVVVSKAPYKRVMIGRGTRAYKGPYIAWLNALEALIAVQGAVPVNIMFLLEGDEILGSPHYPQMFNRYRERLQVADACFSPGMSQDAQGNVSLTLGFKTFIPLQLRVSGKSWGRGPQGHPVHAMGKSVVDSPVWRLVHALASLTEDDGNTVKLPGFYDSFPQPTEEERIRIEKLRKQLGNRPFGSNSWQGLLRGTENVERAISDWSDEEVFLKYFYGPSMNIYGLQAGYTGPGTKAFTLPSEASSRIDIRLPRGSKAQPVIESLRQHLDKKGYEDIEIQVFGAYDSSQADPNCALVNSIRDVFRSENIPLIEFPSSGGGGPWSLYSTELGIPSIRDVGVGFGGNVGTANEFLVIDGDGKAGGLVECELNHAHMLLTYALS